MDSLRVELDLIHSELKHLSQRVAKLESGHRGSSIYISPQASMEQIERQRQQVERQERENRNAAAFLRHIATREPSKWDG